MFKNGQFDAADKAFGDILKKAPKAHEACYWRGAISLRAKRGDDAVLLDSGYGKGAEKLGYK